MKAAKEALEIMKKYYHQRDLAALEWKKRGVKVVGCVGISVPEELIIAGGCLPIQVTGDPDNSLEAGDEYMEDTIVPHVRSIHNLFVMGKYDFLDLAVFPHTDDSLKRCYYGLWTEKHELDPDLKIPVLTVFDLLHSRKYIGNEYVRGRMEAFKDQIEKLSDRKISKETLLQAIELCNENRRLLKKIAALRSAEPPRISGVEALQIIGASFFMSKEEHNELLKDFLAGADQFFPKNGVRLYVSGSIIDNTRLYELIESCGAVVVSEDVSTGNRYSDNLVDTSTEDLLDALVDRYHAKSHDGRIYPITELADYVVNRVKESKAQGVIFNYLQWDDVHAWNYPTQRDALNAIGIPSIAFDMQQYKLESPEQLRTRIEAFLEMIGR